VLIGRELSAWEVRCIVKWLEGSACRNLVGLSDVDRARQARRDLSGLVGFGELVRLDGNVEVCRIRPGSISCSVVRQYRQGLWGLVGFVGFG
jgi:hypothetical protein